jgi:hypothetical protein
VHSRWGSAIETKRTEIVNRTQHTQKHKQTLHLKNVVVLSDDDDDDGDE